MIYEIFRILGMQHQEGCQSTALRAEPAVAMTNKPHFGDLLMIQEAGD